MSVWVEVAGERGGEWEFEGASTSPSSSFLWRLCKYNFESALYLAFGASVREAGVSAHIHIHGRLLPSNLPQIGR